MKTQFIIKVYILLLYMILIFQFENDPGFGDNLRGLISMIEMLSSIKRKLDFYVDFSKSHIYNFVKHRIPEHLQNANHDYVVFVDSIHNKDQCRYIIENTRANILRINHNFFPEGIESETIPTGISEETKNYIKNILTFSPEFEEIFSSYLNKLPEYYKVYHFRYGDSIFSNDIYAVDDRTFNLFVDLYNNQEDTLVISDSLNMKKILSENFDKHIYTFLNKPTHTNNSDNAIDIFIDLFLISRSKGVYCYSSYVWVSGFINWISAIYSVPVFNLKHRGFAQDATKTINASYSWENEQDRYSIFFNNGTINLSNTEYGNYHFVSINTISSFFGGYWHTITFNSTYTSFISVREDGEKVCGNLLRLNKVFSWGEKTKHITFNHDYTLNLANTEYGRYMFVKTNQITTFFGGYNHNIVFNKDFTFFVSTREDGEIVTGKIIEREWSETRAFITFGRAEGSKYDNASIQLYYNVEKLCLFDITNRFTCEILMRECPEFRDRHSHIINKKGSGYWLWKSYLIKKTMEGLKDGDILLYVDCDYEVNFQKRDEFLRNFDIVKKDLILCGNEDSTDIESSKYDLIHEMGMTNHPELFTPQKKTGAILILVCEKTIKFVNEWYELMCNYHNIDDSPSILPNASFKEHKNDQSVFSLLIKKYGLTTPNTLNCIYFVKKRVNYKSLVVTHNAGFFSCCSVRLGEIINFINKTNEIPLHVDSSRQFEWYKTNKNRDITYEYFKHNSEEIEETQINFCYNAYQFIDYSKIDYDSIRVLVKKFFSVSDEITNIISSMENKYNLDYDNICVIFYRGNDKNTEINISGYDEYLNYANFVKSKNENVIFLLQSDETEFFEFMTSRLSQCIIFNDEIRHIRKCNSTVDIVFWEKNDVFSKYYLAITVIMSKCKYIVCGSGNCSLWIMLYRGNSDNVCQNMSSNYMNRTQENVWLNRIL